MRCPNCNSKLPNDAFFCDSCGTPIKGKQAKKPSKFKFGQKTVNSQPHQTTNNVPPTPSRESQPVPWYNRTTLNWRKVQETWVQKLLRKCIIATILTLTIAIAILIIKIWPGCLISVALLLFAIATTIMSFLIQLPEVSDGYEAEKEEKRISKLLNHLLNMILIWEAFWLAAGLVCLSFTWWAVLIAEIVNIIGLLIFVFGILDELN